MTAAVLVDTSYAAFRRIVLTYLPGATVTVDYMRPALEAAQIPPTSYGPYFRKALREGLLTTAWETVPSTWPESRGRRITRYERMPAEDPWAEDVA